jgi:hypothetical protein
MRTLLPLAAALLAASCSGSPTAPTPVTGSPSAVSPSPLANLRWDVATAGCPVKSPPSPIPNAADAQLEPGAHGTIVAYWPAYRIDSRRVMLHATLIEHDAQLVVCDWDIADL